MEENNSWIFESRDCILEIVQVLKKHNLRLCFLDQVLEGVKNEILTSTVIHEAE